MSKKDAIEEGIKLYRIWALYGVVGGLYFIEPIFGSSNLVTAQYWLFSIFGLIFLASGLYAFWKFYIGVQELNELSNRNRNPFMFLFMEMEIVSLLPLMFLLTWIFWS